MNSYRNNNNIKVGLFFVGLILIIGLLGYSNAIVNRLRNDNRDIVKLYSNLLEQPKLKIDMAEIITKNLFLNDKYYSDSKSKMFLKRGYSLNKIRYNLIKKGINEKYIKSSISKIKESESDPDFFSAIKICKRRRIGPTREESNRSLFYKKDISILARSGFSYEVSKKVLEISKEEFKKFCKMI